MRSKYGNQWTLPASHLANTNLQQEITKFQSNLIHAGKSDQIVKSKFLKIKDTLRLLCGSESDIKSLLPSSDSPSKETLQSVKDLKNSLAKLDDILAERETLLKEVLSLTGSDDISSDLMNSDNTEETINQSLEKYNEYDIEISKNIDQQQKLFNEIYELNQVFLSSNSSSGSSREASVKQINEALDVCQELFNNLGEATNFYQQFCDLLNTLKTKCEKYVADRNNAKHSLENRLNNSNNSFSQQQQQQQYSYRQQAPLNYYQQSSQQPQQHQQPPPNYSQNSNTQYSYQPPQQFSQNQNPPPQQFIQVQGPDGKPQYIPASQYYQRQ